jgi:uncharacterized protein YqjF (DUF2071 family)
MTATPSVVSESMDRLAPTRRPNERIVMFQNWSELLFLHWVVPAQQIIPHLPPGLELDTFEDRAYVGLVPFTMTGVRPVWSPSVPPLSDFHETNVRTYVHHNGSNPGVWFFSLDAANGIAVRIARALWKLPYHYAYMQMEKRTKFLPAGDDSETNTEKRKERMIIDYKTERLWPGPLPGRCEVRYSPTGTVSSATPGTLEHFLAERYILYAYADGRLLSGQVHHTPYPLQTATVHDLDENLLAAAGIARPDDPPIAHYASGVSVDIFPLRPVSD